MEPASHELKSSETVNQNKWFLGGVVFSQELCLRDKRKWLTTVFSQRLEGWGTLRSRQNRWAQTWAGAAEGGSYKASLWQMRSWRVREMNLWLCGCFEAWKVGRGGDESREVGQAHQAGPRRPCFGGWSLREGQFEPLEFFSGGWYVIMRPVEILSSQSPFWLTVKEWNESQFVVGALGWWWYLGKFSNIVVYTKKEKQVVKK